jgi:type IV secretory pathway TraG/TraD family ATPase VirD4
MNTGEDIYGMRKVLDLSRWVSIILLLLHFYFICYGAFREWGLTAALSDRLLENISRTGVFEKPVLSKIFSLAFLVISLLGAGSRKDGSLGYMGGLVLLVTGMGLYFGCIFVLTQSGVVTTIASLYMGSCFMGWLLIMTGGLRISRVMAYSLRAGFSDKKKAGFPQEERLLETDYSINLKAKYQLDGEIRTSYININGPRGVLLIGSPGSGKSWFIVEPAMEQLIGRGMSMLVFDFKYDALSRYAYALFQKYQHKYPASARFYSINFTDLSRSHRCNLIHPATLGDVSDAVGVSRAILLSLNNTWAHKQGDFFVESPINLLGALIWYLKKYKDGRYCTLPHVIELAQTSYDMLFALLKTEPDIHALVNTFIQVYQNKTMEVLDSQMSSVKIPLGRLASPGLYYVLTGNDLDLQINHPARPAILCLGGDPSRQEALAPILSLYVDRVNKLIHQPGGHPCALVLDEFATVRAASVLQTVAIGRSHRIIPILVVQDISQLRILYTRAEADTIMNMTGNLICGQVGGETAGWVSERFPDREAYRTTVSVNSSDTSVSKAEQSNPAITPATISTLSSGEFAGIVADDPGKEMEFKAFHAKVVKEKSSLLMKELPVVRQVDAAEIKKNFQRVKWEVQELVLSEMARINGDPMAGGVDV